MNLDDPLNQLPQVIAESLGVEVAEITDLSDFRLDFNATNQDLQNLQATLESSLEVTLPDFTEIDPFTYNDLRMIVEDSII